MISSFPEFASIWSLVQARAALDGRIQAQSQQLAICGNRLLHRPVFGYDLNKLSAAYVHLISPDKLLREHTPFSAFGKLLSIEVETAALAHAAKTGRFEPRRFFPGERNGSLVTAASRWCQRCVDEDHSTFGFAFWRVHHHLPGLKHCWTHERPLVQSCSGANCRATPNERFNLFPGDPCVCGQPEEMTSAQSPGYRAYATLMRRLALEKDLRLDPSRRLAPPDTTGRSGKRLLKSWDCEDAEALSKLLECTVSETQLTRLSHQQELGCHPALLVAWNALHAADHQRSVDAPTADTTHRLSPSDWSVVRATAARTGFPISAAKLLVEGSSPSSLEERHGIASTDRARSFLAALPAEITSRVTSATARPRQAQIFRASGSAAAEHRARAESWLARGVNTRTALARKALSTYEWLLHNDAVWLQERLPLRGKVISSAAHEAERARRRDVATSMKQLGITTRDGLNKQPRSPYRWLKKNDHQWLDENFPLKERVSSVIPSDRPRSTRTS